MELLVHMPVSVVALMKLRVGRGESFLCVFFYMHDFCLKGVRLVFCDLLLLWGVKIAKLLLVRRSLHFGVVSLERKKSKACEEIVWQHSMSHYENIGGHGKKSS